MEVVPQSNGGPKAWRQVGQWAAAGAVSTHVPVSRWPQVAARCVRNSTLQQPLPQCGEDHLGDRRAAFKGEQQREPSCRCMPGGFSGCQPAEEPPPALTRRSQSASQPVSQSASQPVSQSASQPVSQSASQAAAGRKGWNAGQDAGGPVLRERRQRLHPCGAMCTGSAATGCPFRDEPPEKKAGQPLQPPGRERWASGG
jgi:hypothetical protein